MKGREALYRFAALAERLTERLCVRWPSPAATGLTAVEMEAEENFGQADVYRLSLG